MSHVSISRSYAVLVGLEAYIKARKRGKSIVRKLVYHKDKILAPEEVAEREEETRDKTKSAAREKQFLKSKENAEKEEKNAANRRFLEKFKIRGREAESGDKDLDIQAPGPGPENAIAPEGTRVV